MKQKILTVLSILSVLTSGGLSAVFVIQPEAYAYTSPGKPSGFVNDYANIIPDDRQQALEQNLVQFRNDTSNEIVVATVQNLGGDSKENFALELAREWGIGGQQNGNGVLVLVSMDERAIRIEVSQKLEGAITDLYASRVAQNIMVPRFRDGDYAGGIEQGVSELQSAAKGEYNLPQNDTSSSSGGFDWVYIAFFGVVWLASFLARSKSWWAGGVIGAIVAATVWIFASSLAVKVILAIFAPLLGLLLDWLVSRNYQKNIARGGSGGFIPTLGGFSSGGSKGGFGGFGGGGSFGGGGGGGNW